MLLAKAKALYEKVLIKPLFYAPNDLVLNLVIRLHYGFLIIMALNYLQARIFVQQSDSLYSDIGVYGIALIVFCTLNIFGLSNVFTRLMVWLLAVFTFKGANGFNMNVEVVFATVPPLFFMFSNLTSSLANLKGRGDSFVSGYPNFLAGLLFTAYIFFGGGVTKILDPQWLYGVGYYHTFALKWIRPSHLGFFQESFPAFLIFFNYVALAIEFLLFPLYLIPRTRKIAAVLCVLFAAQLFYPLIIHQIGAFALTYVFFIAAIFLPRTLFSRSLVSRFIQRISFLSALNRRAVESAKGIVERISSPFAARRAVYLSMLGYMAFLTYHCMKVAVDLRYPRIGGGRECVMVSSDSFQSLVATVNNQEVVIDSPYSSPLTPMQPRPFSLLSGLGKQFASIYKHFNRSTYYFYVSDLFTAVHNIGINTYTLEVVYADSSKYYPLQMFDMDGTSGPDNFSLTSTRLFQVDMYWLSDRYHRIAQNPEEGGRYLVDFDCLHRLVNYALYKVPVSRKEDIAAVNVYLISQRTPYKYDELNSKETEPSTFLFAWYDAKTNLLHAPDKLVRKVYGTYLPLSQHYLMVK